MQTFHGKSVFGGIAIGRILIYKKQEQQVKRSKITDCDAEIRRFRESRDKVIEQLKGLYEVALKKIGESEAAIFEIHQMMLEDMDYNESIESIIISQEVNAEYAVAATGDNFAQMFSNMDDDYMRGRAADVKDVSERLLGNLTGNENGCFSLEGPSILVAEDLVPSETVQLDKEKVLAFVTVKGSVNSHTAILARTMNIPALIGVELSEEVMGQMDGKIGIVDGFSGSFHLDPEESLSIELQKRMNAEDEKKRLLKDLRGKANITLDGKEIKLYANIGNSKDLAMVLQNDAAGIGLFRSEFIYLEKKEYPTEEEQFTIYKTVAQTMAGKKVIIRTLDIGADKQADYFKLDKEENPAMGCRAIRICLTRPEIFKTQLRALFRASAFGNIAIMYPMIISVEEVRRIREITKQVEEELNEQGIAYGLVEQGIMIETPAAVMVSEELAKEVDFFSIGTNDLTQYTLAIDRQNPQLDEFYDAHHPAVLRMIQMVIENAHKAGIWVGICGELGADAELTSTFLKMGVDELSVSPGYILPLRKIIRETDVSKL
ncbi:phosphoenolpyruvate--protein phosphotransferase [Anaerocolumna chitinilytica]|uniref:Phosphoenolpyruvate-protein phosphotransferase n=1 Tax=Anaerocolumna chitinilytica TaxID=1727145 RepID=A0A7M3S9L4_9FIRM|nr:phosphoenolpyruvate--protein phosphotransferase [Anaerocolumna chitinilytica]BCK01282.1 phosphoenolpyruvate-protein phosphotransferase [Anaerocolumna chitinilytica]